MAKLASLNNDRVAAQLYFSQTQGVWNYFSSRNWSNKESLARYKKWAQSEENHQYQEVIESIAKDSFIVFSKLLESMEYLKDVFLEKDIFGNTLLHNLAEFNAPEYLNFVSTLGINLNTYNDDGYTPLQVAAINNQYNNVAILLNHGAKPYQTTAYNKNTVLHLVAMRGYTDIAKLLIDKEPELITVGGWRGNLAIGFASRNGYLETVTFLLKEGMSEIDWQDGYLFTHLHYAVERGHLDIVKLLAESGADTSLKNRQGYTALSYARKKGFNEIVDYLTSIGAADSVVVEKSSERIKAAAIYSEANKHYSKAGYLKAKTGYLKAIETDPSYHLAYYALGLVAMNFENNLIQSDKYFNQAIKTNPEYAESYYWKGRVNYKLQKPEVYQPLFNKYIKMAPNTYNSKNLLKNWSHILSDNTLSNKNISLEDKFKIFLNNYSKSFVAFFSILLLLLLYFRHRSQKAD